MRSGYKIFRAVAVTLLALAVGLPALLYIILSIGGVQNRLKSIAEVELSRLLGTEVSIGGVSLQLFNQATLTDISVKDAYGADCLNIERLSAGVDLKKFFVQDSIIVTYAELESPRLTVYRDSAGSRLNIQPIIEALSPKDSLKPPTRFNFQISYVTISRLSGTYDVRTDSITPGKFNPHHIAVKDMNLRAELPCIKNDDFSIVLRQLSFAEESGFVMDALNGNFHITSSGSSIKGLNILLPRTHLKFADIVLDYSSWKTLINDIKHNEINVEVLFPSYVTLADFRAFVPVLNKLDHKIETEIAVNGNFSNLTFQRLSVSIPEQNFYASLPGHVTDIDKGIKSAKFDFPSLEIKGNGNNINAIVQDISRIGDSPSHILRTIGDFAILGNISGSLAQLSFNGKVNTAQGEIDSDVTYSRPNEHSPINISGTVRTPSFNIGKFITGNNTLGSVALDIELDVTTSRPYPTGSLIGMIDFIEFKGYKYRNLSLDVKSSDNILAGRLNLLDPNATIYMEGHVNYGDKSPATEFYIEAENINPATLNLTRQFPAHNLSFKADASLAGNNVNDAEGWIKLNDIHYLNPQGQGVRLNQVDLEAYIDADSTKRHIALDSDILQGHLEGNYDFLSIVPTAKMICDRIFPALSNHDNDNEDFRCDNGNNFTFDLTVKDNDAISRMVETPIKIIHPITFKGVMNCPQRYMSLKVDAPFLQQKDKLIEGSSLEMIFDSTHEEASLYATTTVPTKRGPLLLVLDNRGTLNHIDSEIEWVIAGNRSFSGNINFATNFTRDEDGLCTNIGFNPSDAVFNDTVWNIHHSNIKILDRQVDVDHFLVSNEKQYLSINGTASADSSDVITLALRDINLDYIFQTLNINNVMFGGNATGDFYASSLFSKTPLLYTPKLSVTNLSYNNCVMGDGEIRSAWNPTNRSISIDAAIAQKNGLISLIKGSIKPFDEELDFQFDAHKANVGFLQPFMSAFASDVSGYASGKAHLYGTFKLIDMTGDIYAENLKLKLDFTNTYYSAQDSVHITPGHIEFKDIELKDMYGNSAKLSGILNHKCFKQPKFKFTVSDAHNLLVYDVKENADENWYGRVFGDGSATVTGAPGIVNIGVNMTTTGNSSFTFVLSDTEVANDYTFITLRDKDRVKKDSIEQADSRTALIKNLKRRIAASSDPASVYNMDISVYVTPQTAVNLIMDPVGGDRIRANGHGNLRMTYNSASEELKMFGTYTLSRGYYNFTLQDIIIKDFNIKDGSSITFRGDPYAAQLDIKAIYALNANLSDLDESFLQDKELNRTNVPVHALLLVTGDMRRPDINFDIEFPTLTQDTYRKVRSIISTEDMMNRQIIYLLALNRFYTPDYMASTTKGNELVSVASSTISSQLGSILGQLSDNWSIAPNFRSDRGDFSDVEVDVALSSQLLNNRLLLNGNFGYRDKSLNNNSFIGDFDIEYLLNRAGTIRLKAYNRYNDQNFYVKNALTTQGVGVVFKRDFDNIFSFLKPHKQSKHSANDSLVPDTVTVVLTDTLVREITLPPTR